MMKWPSAVCVVLLVGLGTAAAQPPPGYAPIPPPRVEVVPPPPNPRVMWQPGHWHWDGIRYVWIGGHYVQRGPHRARYVPGGWVWAPRQGRWVWRPSHWQ